jgi:hypothetical protein
MGIKNVRNFLFNKLFFPKAVIINKPGVIYSYVDRKFGSPVSKRRMIYFFEDTFVNLQVRTIKKLGLKKTQLIYYQLSKKQVARYLLIANLKKPPSFLVAPIIKYIMKIYRSAGASAAEKVSYNHKKKILVLEGSNNLFCRKSKIGEYLAGGASIIVSFLTGENIEAKSECEKCPQKCRIVANKKFKEKLPFNYDELKPSKKYNKLNFPENMRIPRNLNSFSDLINFKKIWMDNLGKLCFRNKALATAEIGWVSMVSEHYKGIKEHTLFKEGIIEGSNKIAKEILKDVKSVKKRINTIISMLATFGWGIPYYKRERDKIVFSLVYAPFSKYDNLYQVYVINGYINYIFNKQFELECIKIRLKPFTLDLVFHPSKS